MIASICLQTYDSQHMITHICLHIYDTTKYSYTCTEFYHKLHVYDCTYMTKLKDHIRALYDHIRAYIIHKYIIMCTYMILIYEYSRI